MICRCNTFIILLLLISCGPVFSQYVPEDGGLRASLNGAGWGNASLPHEIAFADSISTPFPAAAHSNDYLVKIAYGRTFGTSTQLDYATLELSRRVSAFPALTYWGAAVGEVQVAALASYVVYYEGPIERTKRLDFRDGYELAWIPKGRFTFPYCSFGVSPYVESGAGLSYVSETYRNSGSRFNWSFVGGFGLEKEFCDTGVFSLGVQWRHMCNGNMWGKGDELHNSNSGTDMIQGLATLTKHF